MKAIGYSFVCFCLVGFLIIGVSSQDELLAEEQNSTQCLNYIDLMIIVDGSHSVTPSNFQYVKQWIKALARGFDIDEGNVQVGVVQYSYWYPRRPMWRQRYIKTEIQLGQYKNLTSFNQAVDRIRYQGFRTFTAHAINKTVDYDFQGRRSRYPDAQRAIILLTDGKATDSRDLPGAIRHAEHDAGVVIFAVGVGDYSISELLTITSGNRQRIFELKNFKQLTSIVYELPFTLRKACDCNAAGSVSNDCDSCTRKCTCKENVIGRRCDQCAPGHFNISREEGCQPCKCNPEGTFERNTCNKETGDCTCRYYGVKGKMCDGCRDGMYGFPKCKRCRCNGFSTTCSYKLGICTNCTDNRGGISCETCKSGFYMTKDKKCESCQCNGHIDPSDPLACDGTTGECTKCLHGTAGPHCEFCDQHHYMDDATGTCEKCSCNSLGTDPATCTEGNCTCDAATHQCTCSPNVIGLTCDQCADGFWGLAAGSECESCDCHGQGSVTQICNKETGQCECLPGHTGQKCEKCERGHLMSEDERCTTCDCNLSGSVNGTCIDGVCSCDTETGQCPCRPNISGLSCDHCETGSWGFGSESGCTSCECNQMGSISTSCEKNTGQCECLPGYTGLKCKECDATFYGDPEIGCQACNCDLNGTIGETCFGGVCSCDPVGGQCTCLPNLRGMRCDECADGFWGFDSQTRCESCGCNPAGSISENCNKITGQCACHAEYYGRNCENCLEGYFKLPAEKVCRACNCNLNGSNPDLCNEVLCSCDPTTGQCPCRPNIQGVSCDECKDGFWHIDSGCKECECSGYGSVSANCNKNTGQCECLQGNAGMKCDICDDFHFGDPELGCQACNCNPNGTTGDGCSDGDCTCDSVSGQCSCLPNVEGMSCNQCSDGFWNFESDQGCSECGCNVAGTLLKACNKENGKCECLPEYSGVRCGECSRGYFGNPELECKECSCDFKGTISKMCGDGICSCDQITGQCPCLPNIEGLSCDICVDGYWGFREEEGCRECGCSVVGSLIKNCDKTSGQCECLPGYTGLKCVECEDRYFGNPEVNCEACSCELSGTRSESCIGTNCSCESATGQCQCLPNVRGIRCDECKNGFWKFGWVEGCEECGCSDFGSQSPTCDKNRGQCDCLRGYSGMECDRCDDQFHGDPLLGCQECHCNPNGTERGVCTDDGCTCDSVTGQCTCLSNVVGLLCDQCLDGFWGLHSEEGCSSCGCSSLGSMSDVCSKKTGQCDCLPGYEGLRCDKCLTTHFKNENRECEECSCNLMGTESEECQDGQCACDTLTAQCPCLPNVEGTSCDKCSDGFWGHGSVKGCSPCDCHGSGSNSSECNENTGQCDCLPGFHGLKCEKCAEGHFRGKSEKDCHACDCNLSGSVNASCIDGVCSCDSVTGQCPCLPNVVGLSCDSCPNEYWGFGSKSGCKACKCSKYGSISSVCNKDSGYCDCLPEYTGAKCNKCAKGYYKDASDLRCKKCSCDERGTNSSRCVDGVCECDPITGQCPCLPNVVGLSCDKCDDEFWDLGNPEGCKSCACDNEGCRSRVCNKDTGMCDCLPGHVGPKCENCDRGYFRRKSNVTCQKCNCNMYGRDPNSCNGGVCSCDVVTGQCNCLPNVNGSTCDKCADGFWDINSMQGCKHCQCHLNGSSSVVCEKKTGQCQCKEGHSGVKCNECAKGYWKKRYGDECKPDSLNDEPSETTPTTETKKTEPTKSTTTTSKATTTKYTTRRNRTFRPPIRPTRRPTSRLSIYPASTTRSPSRRYGCNRCSSWPSYCYGWMCRRRWPHQTFTPAPQRCNYGNLICRHNVQSMHNSRGMKYPKSTVGYSAYGGSYRVSSTIRPTRRTTLRPKYGYRAYQSNPNYYIPYYSRRRPHSSTQMRTSSKSGSKPLSYGLYHSLYRKH